MRCLVLAGLLAAACAPSIDGPIEQQRAVDRFDAARLAVQLAQLPGAVHADVTLHRPVVDPLTQHASSGSAAIVVVVDDGADPRAIRRSATALVRGTAPEIAEPAIIVELGATRPVLTTIGPLTVEAGSRSRVVAALAGLLALIAMLSGWIAWRERWRVSAS